MRCRYLKVLHDRIRLLEETCTKNGIEVPGLDAQPGGSGPGQAPSSDFGAPLIQDKRATQPGPEVSSLGGLKQVFRGQSIANK
jgi:hypothetical protein